MYNLLNSKLKYRTTKDGELIILYGFWFSIIFAGFFLILILDYSLPKTEVEDQIAYYQYHNISNGRRSRIPAEVVSVFTLKYHFLIPDGKEKLFEPSHNVVILNSLILSDPTFVLTEDRERIELKGLVGRINFNSWMLFLFSSIALLLHFRLRALEHFYAVYLLLFPFFLYQIAAYRSFYLFSIVISLFILGILLSTKMKNKNNG